MPATTTEEAVAAARDVIETDRALDGMNVPLDPQDLCTLKMARAVLSLADENKRLRAAQRSNLAVWQEAQRVVDDYARIRGVVVEAQTWAREWRSYCDNINAMPPNSERLARVIEDASTHPTRRETP
jgi:hypothetical protein